MYHISSCTNNMNKISSFILKQEWLSRYPKKIGIKEANVKAYIDGGYNAHIFIDECYFHILTPTKGKTTQVTGDIGECDGVGYLNISFYYIIQSLGTFN